MDSAIGNDAETCSMLTRVIGCIGVLATFSIGDMIVYNRRKRAIYLADQARTEAAVLETARTAVSNGRATPAQAALVEGVIEEEEYIAKREAERNVRSRFMWWMKGDWKEDKELAQQRKLTLADIKKKAAEEHGLGIYEAVQQARQTGADGTSIVGGPLDNAAENAVQSAEKTGKGWLGWAFNKKKEE